MNTVKVRMLGRLSVSSGEITVDDSSNRSKKVWLLLAYLIYNRHRPVTQQELIELLWGKDSGGENPVGALKTTLYRARRALASLSAENTEFIVRRRGGYIWNSDVPIELDTENFEAAIRFASSSADENVRLEYFRGALELYEGDFLGKLSSEAWAIPISAYYHNLYIRTVLDTLALMRKQPALLEAEELCRAAIQIEPCQEELYQSLMQILSDAGDHKSVTVVYDVMRDILFSNFGVLPSEESQAIYRESLKTVNDTAISPSAIHSQLREGNASSGALICDYDFFKVLYQAEARGISRRGDAVHIAILSVNGKDGKNFSRRALDKTMENLQNQIYQSLRRSDTAARCSASQYILMLPQANYENSCMVCERIVRSFARHYPSSSAVISYSVHPLEPASGGGSADPAEKKGT